MRAACSSGSSLERGGAAGFGLRNPCGQIESFKPGLLAAVLDRAADGSLRRLAGVMAVVARGGEVRPGDAITVVQRPDHHQALEPV